MFYGDYIFYHRSFWIILLIISVIPLLIYIRILRRKLRSYSKKLSLISTQDELKKFFSSEESEKYVRLKKSGKDTAKRFDMVSVLFADIQGFTRIVEEINPESLIDELDEFFYRFDTVVENLNIEKIKTIGDAYMCAGGIPVENRSNPIDVVLAALEMQQFMKEMKRKKGEMWDVRIGIHTGSVIAGIVGHKKISYDIWGDSVNTASRMESSCTPGKINISGQTYEFVKDFFDCEYRGKMPVKYKGNIDMYYVNDIKPQLKRKVDGLSIRYLDLKLQILRLFDVENYILQQFEKYANPDNTYHNIKNAIDLYSHAELFARSENLDEKNMLLVLTAALLMNTGYLISYEKHHEETIRFAKNILVKYKYTNQQIQEICNLIAILDKEITPNGLNEMILTDARNSFIGRVDFEELVLDLYKEEKRLSGIKTEVWKEKMLHKLQQHKFYTVAASTLQEVSVSDQIRKFKKIRF